ncbi:MAG TPA: hypothetical protein VJ438_01150 [Candidatus Nanoarchaeia archaeon]|nr:hypothetical protein [Candidatus Nanoarchaeia archaeon]
METYLQMIIDVVYKFSSFNKGKPIMCESLQSVLEIMKEYGFNVNLNKEKR